MTMDTLWIENLHRIIARIDADMPAEKPANDVYLTYEEFQAHQRELDALVTTLVHDEGGSHRRSSGAETLRLCGIQTSCTSGPHGLLRNWQNAARRKIAEAAPADEPSDVINLAGSGPVPIEAREEIAPPASAMRGTLSIGGLGGVGELTIEVGEAPSKLCIDKDWLKQKIGEDGEEGEIGAGFEMFPLPIQAREG